MLASNDNSSVHWKKRSILLVIYKISVLGKGCHGLLFAIAEKSDYGQN